MKVYFDEKRDRLIYIGGSANQGMWETRWAKEDLNKLFFPPAHLKSSSIVLETTKKYIPPGAKILEGGCGLGYNVYFLENSGYETVGVDYASDTVQRVKEFMPGLNVRSGDLRRLDFQDCTFDGYWSLGVIEHYYEGYQEVAQEMFRVLKPGGYLFVTTPAISALRRIKVRLGIIPRFHEGSVSSSNFYQYAFAAEEVRQSFLKLGFEFIESKGWGVYKGISDEIPGTRLIMSLLCRYFEKPAEYALKDFCNHMQLLIFKKKPENLSQ